MVLSNEVYTGAGASATLIPEMNLELGMHYGTKVTTNKKGFHFRNSDSGTIDYTTVSWDSDATGGANATDSTRMVVNIYQGCLAEVTVYESDFTTERQAKQILVIKSNTATSITFNTDLNPTSPATSDVVQLRVLGYGAPVGVAAAIAGKHNLLADNWLGLVNTITPPTVDAEMKQVNLALGGTRNFGFQYKGAETLGEASFDVSLNNASWLYYALGKMAFTAGQQGSDTIAGNAGHSSRRIYYNNATTTLSNGDAAPNIFYRAEGGVICPPIVFNTANTEYPRWNGNAVTYTFSESNGADLPSFALEITNEKGAITDANYYQDSVDEGLFSRIFTGCQVSTFTLNFEEGQEVKATIGAVARKAHDADENYVPKRMVRTPSSLFNYSTSDANNAPYMFSDGAITMFGQTWARVKSGSFTLSNNLTPQRFVGNYDRSITSAHTAGQRTYEISLNLLITDRQMWDYLRTRDETNSADASMGNLSLVFTKTATDSFTLSFDDYIVQSVDMPFPEDKGVMEVAVTLQARTLASCSYTGLWIIQG